MMNLFKRKRSNSPSVVANREIRIVGPRRAGKTTLLAAIAHFPNTSQNSLIQAVEPRDEATAELAEMARDILETGSDFAPTDLGPQPLYSFDVSFKEKTRIQRLQGGALPKMRVSCREYPGEFLQQLGSNQNLQAVQDYIQDCSFSSGLILLVDSPASQADAEYAQAFEVLQKKLKAELQSQGTPLQSYRIAVVFSKCEQSEIWIHRNDIKRFQALKFPETASVISDWCRDWGCQSNSFFCSAFGFRGSNTLEANVNNINSSRGVIRAVLAEPELWQPVGLIAPLYWLQTGIDNPKLKNI